MQTVTWAEELQASLLRTPCPGPWATMGSEPALPTALGWGLWPCQVPQVTARSEGADSCLRQTGERSHEKRAP